LRGDRSTPRKRKLCRLRRVHVISWLRFWKWFETICETKRYTIANTFTGSVVLCSTKLALKTLELSNFNQQCDIFQLWDCCLDNFETVLILELRLLTPCSTSKHDIVSGDSFFCIPFGTDYTTHRLGVGIRIGIADHAQRLTDRHCAHLRWLSNTRHRRRLQFEPACSGRGFRLLDPFSETYNGDPAQIEASLGPSRTYTEHTTYYLILNLDWFLIFIFFSALYPIFSIYCRAGAAGSWSVEIILVLL